VAIAAEDLNLRYADSVADLDAVEPMWNALQEHHGRITPQLDSQTPKRELGDAWRVRRSKYERWLEDPESFFVLEDMAVTTTMTNVDAHRFYEQQGFAKGFVVFHGRRAASRAGAGR
jgi:hypothetical protein